MGYKYETHLHTSNSSKCGASDAREYIPYYKEMGYDGIFVTDHFYLGNTCVPRELPWEQWARKYCEAYRIAKEEGDKQGLKVFFGWETSYDAEDFLIYGLDEEWLVRHPDIITWNQKEQYEHIKADGGLVVQAHPFRERGYMTEIKLHPYHCDAWEIANCGNYPYQDILAYRYAKAHNMVMTAGSDIHRAHGSNNGTVFGVETEEPLNSEQDYVDLVLSGKGFKPHVPDGWLLNDFSEPKDFETFLFDQDNNKIKMTDFNF